MARNLSMLPVSRRLTGFGKRLKLGALALFGFLFGALFHP
jgi:hypothetical protein